MSKKSAPGRQNDRQAANSGSPSRANGNAAADRQETQPGGEQLAGARDVAKPSRPEPAAATKRARPSQRAMQENETKRRPLGAAEEAGPAAAGAAAADQRTPNGADQQRQQLIVSTNATGNNSTMDRPPASPVNICAACLKPIKERYLLMALEKKWHEDCLKCACCDCRLGEVGSSLFTHSDKLLCRRDFLRIFGQKGLCAACKQTIPPYELVMRANENAYHMDCFACQQCQYRFCVGDRFHLTEMHKIICILCFGERQQQHQHSHLSSPAAGQPPAAQTNQSQQPASGSSSAAALPADADRQPATPVLGAEATPARGEPDGPGAIPSDQQTIEQRAELHKPAAAAPAKQAPAHPQQQQACAM